LNAAFGATREGKRMAFTSLVLQFNLWALPVEDETGSTRSEMRRLTSDLSPAFYPSVSWDGSRVAFSRKGAVSSLGLLDMASGKETTLLTSATAFDFPHLSGDGRWVAFAQAPASIFRIASRGGTVTRICDNCGVPVSSSPDGGKLLMEPGDGPQDVREIDVTTGKIATLVPAREQLYSADLTRDGNWVAFHAVASGDSAHSQVFAARVDADRPTPPSEWIPITEADAFYQGPRWSPDGGVLYFLSNRDGFRCVWARRVDRKTKAPTGPVFAVQHLHHSRRSLQHLARFDDRVSLAVAPGMLVMVAGDLTGNIWMREQKVP
jgi:Tol biopolymer transport system component